MKSRTVETVTSNEGQVRLRIFDGDLQVSEAGAELLRMLQAQYDAERASHEKTREALIFANQRLTEALDRVRSLKRL